MIANAREAEQRKGWCGAALPTALQKRGPLLAEATDSGLSRVTARRPLLLDSSN